MLYLNNIYIKKPWCDSLVVVWLEQVIVDSNQGLKKLCEIRFKVTMNFSIKENCPLFENWYTCCLKKKILEWYRFYNAVPGRARKLGKEKKSCISRDARGSQLFVKFPIYIDSARKLHPKSILKGSLFFVAEIIKLNTQ